MSACMHVRMYAGMRACVQECRLDGSVGGCGWVGCCGVLVSLPGLCVVVSG